MSLKEPRSPWSRAAGPVANRNQFRQCRCQATSAAELAGSLSPAEVAREVRKRLSTIARSRSFSDWQNRKALVEDLDTQRRAIVDQVGSADPAEALDLMWRFLRVFGHCDDSSATVRMGRRRLGRAANRASAGRPRIRTSRFRLLVAARRHVPQPLSLASEHHADAGAVQRRPEAAGADHPVGAPDRFHGSLLADSIWAGIP
jgi:hypothetical protein